MDDYQKSIYIEESDSGKRIDIYLSDIFPDISRSHFQKMIERGEISVVGKNIRSNYRLKEKDRILIEKDPVPAFVEILPQDIPLSVIYEDDDILIVDKPKDMVVHPAPGHPDGTLVNAIMYHCRDRLSGINGELRPGIVHRIDKDTTGSLVVCKNDRAHHLIAEQIACHSIRRSYLGIVCGVIKEEFGTVNEPIGRNPKDRKKMAVVSGGREAITHYKVLKRLKGYTYLQFDLETGRTHQIRVHMAHIGHPLLGDAVYGPAKCPFKLQGQSLHAWKLGFVHPSLGEYVEFEAKIPDYMQMLIRRLEVNNEQ